jgi:hypothetical protein
MSRNDRVWWDALIRDRSVSIANKQDGRGPGPIPCRGCGSMNGSVGPQWTTVVSSLSMLNTLMFPKESLLAMEGLVGDGLVRRGRVFSHVAVATVGTGSR